MIMAKMMSESGSAALMMCASTRRQLLTGIATVFGGLTLDSAGARAAATEEISHASEAIHQELALQAGRERVYQALTDAQQFNRIEQISEAKDTSMPPRKSPAQISRHVGGTFTLFGGIILGRQIELVPNQRIVQAWRVKFWAPGVYSIAKFELAEYGGGTKIVFDHTGFPRGMAEHLAAGWKAHYWQPLTQFLSQPTAE